MDAKLTKKEGIFLFCLMCSVLALLFASSSSSLYATNFWTDTNIYFTIGRGLKAGLMPYRDLFDHKGPLLFLLYGLAAIISKTDFSGVFLLEVLSLAAFLFIAFDLASRKRAGWFALAAPPLAAFLACHCRAFTQGGSAEEFCLPFLLLGIASAEQILSPMEEQEKQTKSRSRVSGVLFGVSASFVFLIKYTDIGLFAGLGFFVMLYILRDQGWGMALRVLEWMLAGFFIPVLLVFGYYSLHGALWDCVRVYFLENLTDYSGAPMSLRAHLWNALAYLRTQSESNPSLAFFTGIGILGAFVSHLKHGKRGAFFAALALPAGAGCLLLTCYWGEMAHPYYALVFAATAISGVSVLLSLLGRIPWGRHACPVALALSILMTFLLPVSLSRKPELKTLRTVKPEEMPQRAFAETMRENSPDGAFTLLDLTSLDQGFYLASGVLPVTRYFADNNLDTEEKRTAINSYLADSLCDYVVTVWREPGENYEPVAEATGFFDLADKRTYRLWRRKTE